MALSPPRSEPPPLVSAPIDHPIMTQRWADLVFVHWRYEPSQVQRLLPPGVRVDTFDGSAWVALVPFRMENLRLRGLPRLPGTHTFPEVNVRTYVTAGSRRGVWFFSLDIDKLLPTAVARLGYQLPYCYGRVEHQPVGEGPGARLLTSVERRWPAGPSPAGRRPRNGATMDVALEHHEPDGPSDLHTFLTSRWGLITASRRGRLRFAPVDHPAWELRHGRLLELDETLVEASGLAPPAGDAHVMWSPGVEVTVGLPRPVERPTGPRPS